jgi:hypothetical protein
MKSSIKNRDHSTVRNLMRVLAVCIIFTANTAQSAIIAFTNFDNHGLATANVANDTATDLNWVLNGVADPGNLTAIDINGAGPGFNLFNGNSTVQNGFAPNLNIRNEGPWSTTITLESLTGSLVTLQSITFDQFNLNNIGAAKTQADPVDFIVSVTSGGGLLGTQNISNSGGPTASLLFLFTNPIEFTLGQTYDISIVASADSGNGNNVGIDNLSINGLVTTLPGPVPVPEPSSLTIFSLALLTLVLRARKKL